MPTIQQQQHFIRVSVSCLREVHIVFISIYFNLCIRNVKNLCPAEKILYLVHNLLHPSFFVYRWDLIVKKQLPTKFHHLSWQHSDSLPLKLLIFWGAWWFEPLHWIEWPNLKILDKMSSDNCINICTDCLLCHSRQVCEYFT